MIKTEQENKKLTDVLARVFERWTPNPLIIAIILTFIVMVMAFVLTESSTSTIVLAWGKGLTGLLAFMTQIALAILFGHVLAHTKRAQRALHFISALPKTEIQAYVMVTLFSSLATLVQWALGLIVGAVLAKGVAIAMRQRQIKVDFPLLIAGSYCGFLFAGLAYNGTIPLTAATAGSFIEKVLGHIVELSSTVFTAYNLIALGALLVLIPAILVWLRPRQQHDEIVLDITDVTPQKTLPADFVAETPAEKVEHSRVLTLLFGLALGGYLVLHFIHNGFALSLDIVNWAMLTCILFMVSSPSELLHLIKNAASAVGDVLIQFPLYAGILGVLSSTGLIAVLSDFFISVATPGTLPFVAFIVAGMVNFAVPSAGGQFALQGPLFLDAAQRLGVDPAPVIMAISYGDTWTNLLQPFFALPLLAIAGLHVRTIFKYTFPVCIVSGLVFTITTLWWGHMV